MLPYSGVHIHLPTGLDELRTESKTSRQQNQLSLEVTKKEHLQALLWVYWVEPAPQAAYLQDKL